METLPKHGHRAPVKEYLRTQCLINICTSCDMTCANDGFASIYPLAQADLAQLVEHNLAKVGVAGSSPVVRSSESSSAASPGEAALFVAVVTRDQAITRPATPQTREVWSRHLVPRAVPTRKHAHSTRESPGGQACKASRPSGLRGRYVDPTGLLGNPVLLRDYFVTITEISSLMVL